MGEVRMNMGVYKAGHYSFSGGMGMGGERLESFSFPYEGYSLPGGEIPPFDQPFTPYFLFPRMSHEPSLGHLTRPGAGCKLHPKGPRGKGYV